MNAARWLGSLMFTAAVSALPAQIDTVQSVASGVYFHQGDPRRGHSNNGWIVFDDYVLLVDANYPSGAQVIMPKIKATTDKPVRFVFDTHHHADHAYGNQLWVDAGAVPVAYVGVVDEMRKVEPARWEASAKVRPDVAATRLKPPTLLFPQDLFFDDGHRRVELRHFGVAHTRGDAMAWLPAEKILFTGDVCVNGPHNNVNDGDTGEWIKTLEAVKALGAVIVCPGHGPMGGAEIIADQQRYFIELRRVVRRWLDAGKTPAEFRAGLGEIAAELKGIPAIARYVPASLGAHVQKVCVELGGQPLPPLPP